eukprot:15478821-Alexandrium_andersonii.AAC.1
MRGGASERPVATANASHRHGHAHPREGRRPPLPAWTAPTNPAVLLRDVRGELHGQRHVGLGGHRQPNEELRHVVQ